jgi:hypothetical protein
LRIASVRGYHGARTRRCAPGVHEVAQKHRWHPAQRTEIGADGKVTVTFRVRMCPELETWALGFGEHAER